MPRDCGFVRASFGAFPCVTRVPFPSTCCIICRCVFFLYIDLVFSSGSACPFHHFTICFQVCSSCSTAWRNLVRTDTRRRASDGGIHSEGDPDQVAASATAHKTPNVHLTLPEAVDKLTAMAAQVHRLQSALARALPDFDSIPMDVAEDIAVTADVDLIVNVRLPPHQRRCNIVTFSCLNARCRGMKRELTLFLRRWSDKTLHWCLRIWSTSAKAYDVLQETEYISVPSVRTLQRLKTDYVMPPGAARCVHTTSVHMSPMLALCGGAVSRFQGGVQSL